jgi:hypothetical protein
VANPEVILSLTAEDNLTGTLKAVQDEMRQMAQANKALQAQLTRFKPANDGVTKGLDKGSGALRSYRSGMAQLGYQIQDVAVQIQGGQNLGIIIGQQGSQIASVFGPGGIVAGAIISIGALLGTALVPQLFESKKSTEDLVEETLKYTDKLQNATQAQRDFVNAFNAEKLQEQRDRLRELTVELDRMAEAQVTLDTILGEGRAGVYFYGATAAAQQLSSTLKDQNETLIEQQNLLSEMGQSDAQAAQAMMETNFENEQRLEEESWKRYQDRLKRERDADEKAAKEKIALAENIYIWEKQWADKRAADELAAAQETIRVEEIIQNTLAGFAQKEKEDKAAQDEWYRQQLQRQLQADVDYYMKVKELSDAVVGNLSSAAGALAANLKEGTRAQMAALAVQKGLAVGQAIMNMHVAISEANKLPFPANVSLVAKAAATGLSAIAGVQAVSFDGGGYTGSGIRAGGMDGKGGMPAILHPNETVVDHTKGQGMGSVTVNLNIQANDTQGFDQLLQQRRGLIVSMINQAVNNRGRVSVA